MDTNGVSYVFIQDGMPISKKDFNIIKDLLDIRDIKVKAKNNDRDTEYVTNFVGFIVTKDIIITSLPKNTYVNYSSLNKSEDRDSIINNLFKVLIKGLNRESSKYLFLDKGDLSDTYPFIPFQQIVNYYNKYGLPHKRVEHISFGYTGKISWKDTIRHSPTVINGNNIIYMPFITLNYQNNFEFLSKCVAYVINITLEIFPFDFFLQKVELEYSNIDFKNTDLILNKLWDIKNKVFKDSEKKLIEALINYFMNMNYEGSISKIKIYNFHDIWEYAVNEYLAKYFYTIDDENNLVFLTKQLDSPNINFGFQRIFTDIDANPEKNYGFKIQPDFYYTDMKSIYLFDAKYYQSVYELDYKQIVYDYILREDNKTMHNYLLLPTTENQNTKIHFKLNKRYGKPFTIYECYLNTREVLLKYIQ